MGNVGDIFWGVLELIGLALFLALAVFGGYSFAKMLGPDDHAGTPEELCIAYLSEWAALNDCHVGGSCRLNDDQFERWQETAIQAMRYCKMTEKAPDKDVQLKQEQRNDRSST